MSAAQKPVNEVERLEALRELQVLDSPPEEAFDRITRLASTIINAPIVLVSLVDEFRQWFKSSQGLDATETLREFAFCAHAILGDEIFVVSDASKDPRFADNPLVTGAPDIRFYAGAPLVLNDGVRVGTLCAIDSKARQLQAHEADALRTLAAVVVDELRLRRIVQQQAETNRLLEERARELSVANEALEQFAYMAAHDLRSPIKTMINMADIALRNAEGDDKPLRFIRRAACELEEVVAGYHRLSCLEVGPKTKCLVSELADDALQKTGKSIATEVRGDASIVCDATMMTQVFANLIENAAKYASSGGVVFDAAEDEDETTIRVQNAFHGTETVDESVFLPFRRLSKEGDGTGVGLSIVKRVAQMHGGTVSASSRGGMFSVELTLPR